ncbi:MAG: hypothetical protein PVF56_05485 [Desulfobacterales bacterium]
MRVKQRGCLIENNFVSTTTRIAGGLNFRPLAEKAKARQCFKRCGCSRVQSTRIENNQSWN